jgi:hypothetical protein
MLNLDEIVNVVDTGMALMPVDAALIAFLLGAAIGGQFATRMSSGPLPRAKCPSHERRNLHLKGRGACSMVRL